MRFEGAAWGAAHSRRCEKRKDAATRWGVTWCGVWGSIENQPFYNGLNSMVLYIGLIHIVLYTTRGDVAHPREKEG